MSPKGYAAFFPSSTTFVYISGKEDPAFYRTCFNSLLPSNWKVVLWEVGTKKRVIDLYGEFDWTRFPKKQILFFVDRDLSCFIPEQEIEEINVYVTARYSIENDLVNEQTCERLLSEIFNLSKLSKVEMEGVLKLFSEQLSKFREQMIPVMAWIIFWRRKTVKVHLDKIDLRQIFKFEAGIISMKPLHYGDALRDLIHRQSGIVCSTGADVSKIEKEFRSFLGHESFIRGKFELWFMVEFCLSVHGGIARFSKVITAPPKMHVTFGHGNAMTQVAPRGRIPDSLRRFLADTCLEFISSKVA